MRFGLFRLAQPQFDNGGGGAGAAAATGNTGAAAGAAAGTTGGQTGTSATGTTETGTAATGAAAQTGQRAATGFTYKEDRSNWVPSHVVRQRTEELERLRREHYVATQRVAALSGVAAPPAPVDPETAAIREQFSKLYPGLAKLEGMSDKFEKLGAMDFDQFQQSIQQAQNQPWVMHGNHFFQVLMDKTREAYGGATLDPKAQKRIARAFAAELEDDADLRSRYEAGDLTVVDEFVKDFTGAVLDPYRRSTAAANVPALAAARRLPRGGGSSAVVGARPASLKPSDPNFHKSAFDRFTQGG